MPKQEELARQLEEVDKELNLYPESKEAVAERVYEIVSGVTVNADRALGQVYEALRPMRLRAALLAKKKQLVKQINAIASESGR